SDRLSDTISSPSFEVSATECAASARSADDPATTPATAFTTVIAAFAAIATQTVFELSLWCSATGLPSPFRGARNAPLRNVVLAARGLRRRRPDDQPDREQERASRPPAADVRRRQTVDRRGAAGEDDPRDGNRRHQIHEREDDQ